MLTATVTSKAFSSNFEIRTASGTFHTTDVSLSPFSAETRVLDSARNQIARMQPEGLLSSVRNIILTGGGSYQFSRGSGNGWFRQSWDCEGEGRTLHISQQKIRTFVVSDNTGEIATCSKPGFFDDYTFTVNNDSDLKLVMCIFLIILRDQESSEISGALL